MPTAAAAAARPVRPNRGEIRLKSASAPCTAFAVSSTTTARTGRVRVARPPRGGAELVFPDRYRSAPVAQNARLIVRDIEPVTQQSGPDRWSRNVGPYKDDARDSRVVTRTRPRAGRHAIGIHGACHRRRQRSRAVTESWLAYRDVIALDTNGSRCEVCYFCHFLHDDSAAITPGQVRP